MTPLDTNYLGAIKVKFLWLGEKPVLTSIHTIPPKLDKVPFNNASIKYAMENVARLIRNENLNLDLGHTYNLTLATTIRHVPNLWHLVGWQLEELALPSIGDPYTVFLGGAYNTWLYENLANYPDNVRAVADGLIHSTNSSTSYSDEDGLRDIRHNL